MHLPDIISDKISIYLKYMTVLEVEGHNFKGSIKTNHCQINWEYDDSQNCCEGFDARSSFGPLTNLIGKHILKKIDLLEVTDQYPDEYFDEGGIWRLVLSDDPKLHIEFSNSHNGYYCHNLDVTIDFLDQTQDPIRWNTSI